MKGPRFLGAFHSALAVMIAMVVGAVMIAVVAVIGLRRSRYRCSHNNEQRDNSQHEFHPSSLHSISWQQAIAHC